MSYSCLMNKSSLFMGPLIHTYCIAIPLCPEAAQEQAE